MRNTEVTKEWLLAHGGIAQEVKCDICGGKLYQGMGYYPLRKVSGYELFCCSGCYGGNCDGWNPRYEAKLLAHLKANGIKPPPRNEKGWLPREFSL
nr:MAG TPA: Cation-transporting ATPase [Caudoviricetes sp.]